MSKDFFAGKRARKAYKVDIIPGLVGEREGMILCEEGRVNVGASGRERVIQGW